MPTRSQPQLIRLLQALLIILASLPAAHAQQEQPSLFETLGKLLQPQVAPVEASEETKPGTRAIAPQPAGSTGKRIALVIGNDAYQKVTPLQKAGNDASAMARELKTAGFDVLLHRDLNYRGMVKAVETLSNKITGGDQVVVFFAGHGIQIKTGSYLLPIDIEASSESEVEKTAYGLADLTEKLSEAKASFTLVMVDACRDNPLKSKGRSVGATRGLSAIEPPKGQMVVYSASKGQQALDRLSDNDNNPNGVFTRSFIARMKKPGVRIEDLVREVQDAVEELAQTVSHEQRPAIYNESRGSFYFFGPTTVNVQPGSATPAAPAQARTPAEIEDSFWNSIKDDREAHGFDEYLKQYPKGRYAAQARVTLIKLKKDAVPTPPAKPEPVAAPVPVPAIAKAEDPESQFWNEVKANGAREYLDAYLKQYPKGKYLALAKVELKKLDDKDRAERAQEEAERKAAGAREKQDAQQAEQDAWDRAKAAGTAAAYASYVGGYPKGRYLALAQAGQQKAQREEMEREKQATQQAEQDTWERARRDDTARAYGGYLDGYPKGRFAELAKVAQQKAQREEVERDRQETARRESEAWDAEQRRRVAEREAEERARQEAARVAEQQRKDREEAARGPQWATEDNGAGVNWAEATRYCASKGSGWRLPTSAELLASYQSGHSTPCGGETCKVSSNSRLSGPLFWTNEQTGSSGAWFVYLYDGDRGAIFVEAQDHFRALCVRRP